MQNDTQQKQDQPTVSNSQIINWVIFVALCLIWGSSFVLMKLGLYGTDGTPVLSAYQVAAIRMLSSGLVLLPFAFGAYKRVRSAGIRWYILLSGLLGSFFPAFLFCIAETHIASSLAGAINAMTPLFVLLVATVVYGSKIPLMKWIGILLGFTGCVLLFLRQPGDGNQQIFYALFAVLATALYGFNVNMVKHKLLHVSSVDIATLAFAFLTLPSLLVLVVTGYFSYPLLQSQFVLATAASAVLGIFGTAIASILFYVLVKRAGIVFPSLVTYGIPFVAIGWGIFYGEKIVWLQVLALIVILAGVYIANLRFPAKKEM